MVLSTLPTEKKKMRFFIAQSQKYNKTSEQTPAEAVYSRLHDICCDVKNLWPEKFSFTSHIVTNAATIFHVVTCTVNYCRDVLGSETERNST